jgi:hypothetical protein
VAMLTTFSDTGTFERVGVLAAMMICWSGLGSLGPGNGRAIGEGCSFIGWSWTSRMKRPWKSLWWVLGGMRGVAGGNQGQDNRPRIEKKGEMKQQT